MKVYLVRLLSLNNYIWKFVLVWINLIVGENGVVYFVWLRFRIFFCKEDNDYDGIWYMKWIFVGNCVVVDIIYYNMVFWMFGDILKVLFDYGDGIKLDVLFMFLDSSELEMGFLLMFVVDFIKVLWDFEGFFVKVLLEEVMEKNWLGRKKGSDEWCIGEGCGGVLVLVFGWGWWRCLWSMELRYLIILMR